MATRSDNMLPVAAKDEPPLVLGGAPLPQEIPDEGGKQARKRRKRQARLQRDAERPPDSFERFRILSELVNEGRQVVDLADHKARYALVVMGVLNAGVFFLMSRSHLFGDIPSSARPWLLGFLVLYAALTFLFVYYAVDCMRPRQLHYADVMMTDSERNGHVPRGVLFWETIAAYGLEEYRRAWSTVRMEQLNSEVVVIAHHLSRLIRRKYVALGRLYAGMAGLVILAAILLTVFTLLGLAS